MTVPSDDRFDKALSDDILSKGCLVRLLAMDVDGVLTDGKIVYDSQGVETKVFFVQDGVGIKALQAVGVVCAIITGRQSPIVDRRAKELGIAHIIQGRDDKLQALSELASRLNITLGECAYMGDDLPDVLAIKTAGLGISVVNGNRHAQQVADYVTHHTGGNGAVREVCELILHAKGQYQAFLARFGL